MPGTKTHSPARRRRSGPGELARGIPVRSPGRGSATSTAARRSRATARRAGRLAGDVVDVGLGRDDGVVGIHSPRTAPSPTARSAPRGAGRHPLI